MQVLDAPSPLGLFNCIFAFVCAPGHTLGGCFEQKEHIVAFSTPDDTVNAALRRVRKGQEAKALKALLSNGVAKVNESVVAAIKKLHPPRVEDLKLPAPVTTQLSILPSDIFDHLFKMAADQQASKDLFGWAGWMLLPWRAEGWLFLGACAVCLLFD